MNTFKITPLLSTCFSKARKVQYAPSQGRFTRDTLPKTPNFAKSCHYLVEVTS